MIGQMVTEIASEAKAGHFAGLVPVILPLLDGRSSHRNGTTGDPNERPHPVVNSGQTRACMQHACEYSRRSDLLFLVHAPRTLPGLIGYVNNNLEIFR